jgi:Txe/YoeB family toxin of toxin-antitoxin system
MYRILYGKQAVKDISSLKSAGLESKAKELVEVVRNNPFQNPPPYEKLVGNLKQFYSRRINIQHRFVYQVYDDKSIDVDGNVIFDGTVKIVSMWSYYDTVR